MKLNFPEFASFFLEYKPNEYAMGKIAEEMRTSKNTD